MSDFIRFPWAVSGEADAVPPTTQPDGAVSQQQGYGPDYSRDLRTDPAAKSIERTKFNGFLNLLTRAMRFLQINGVPEFITASDNGGAPFPYGQGARVRFTGATYVSLEANNTAEPSDNTKWRLVDPISGVANGAITNAQFAANAAIDASKIGNGSVSNAEFQRLDGVTSGIQTQLNGKQPGGNYITGLNGDVVAAGPGDAPATLATTGVTPGTYANANIQVDAKGRIVAASPGVSPFGMVENFESWSGGLPNTLPWSSAQAAQISQSALHVTNGTYSCQFSASGAVTMSATVAAAFLANFGELVVDVYVDTMAGGQRATISCGANSASTPNGATGTFTLRVKVPSGATTVSLAVSGASQVWWDNLRYVVAVSALGTSFNNVISGLTATNVQDAIDQTENRVDVVEANLTALTNKVKNPTIQRLLTSGTWNRPTGCTKIRGRMVGAGGGGAQNTNGGSNGSDGGTTQFKDITALGGKGGIAGSGSSRPGAGGTGGNNGTGATIIERSAGAPGILGIVNATIGGFSKLGFPATFNNATPTVPVDSPPNSGSGGGGQGSGSGNISGGPGGGGEYVYFEINAPAASYTYTIGAGGTKGTNGADGGSGVIEIEEFYA